MTRLDRLRQQLAEAQRKQANLARNGKLIESFAYNTRIANLKDEFVMLNTFAFNCFTVMARKYKMKAREAPE